MALIACSECGKEISDKAGACPHCGNPVASAPSPAPTTAAPLSTRADYEVALLAIPIVTTLLIVFWVAGMNLLQSPGDTLSLLTIGTVIATAIVAAAEASKVGMVSDRYGKSYSPTGWFFIIVLLWIIGYPAYLFMRRSYGLKNRVVAGIVVALIFVGADFAMYSAIEAKKAEVRGKLDEFSQQLQSLGAVTTPAPTPASTMAKPKPTCADVDWEQAPADTVDDAMDRLSDVAGLPDGYTKYHTEVVHGLCKGDTAEVDQQVDYGYVPQADVEKMAAVLGVTYVPKERTSVGRAYATARPVLSSMGLCSACADNAAELYAKDPDSQCGLLVQKALAGDDVAKKELLTDPDFCTEK